MAVPPLGRGADPGTGQDDLPDGVTVAEQFEQLRLVAGEVIRLDGAIRMAPR